MASHNTGVEVEDIRSKATCGDQVSVVADSIACGSGVTIGDRVTLRCNRLILHDHVHIDSDVTIRAETLEIGCGSRIEQRCLIGAIGGPARYVGIGEQSLLGHDSKLLVPVAVIGDYVAIQNHALINGLAPFCLGHNSWVGQNCILNANERLQIGNNVGIGAYSSVYTHGFFGDLLEGSQVYKVAPVTLEDDVWILGSYNIISPGVTIGAKALVLTGSNVTRDVPPNHCVGGAPAKDMTDRLTPYRPVNAEEKLSKMRDFLGEFVEAQFAGRYRVVPDGYIVEAGFGAFRLMVESQLNDSTQLPSERPLLVFAANSRLPEAPAGVTVFDLMARTYTRQRSMAEIRTITWLKNPRARFVPTDRPTVDVPAEYWP